MWPRRRNRAASAVILLLFHAFAGGQGAAMTVWTLIGLLPPALFVTGATCRATAWSRAG